jgi:DNA polymerase-3 subunit delta
VNTLDEQAFTKSLRAGEFFPCYLFEGEQFFIEEAWKDLEKAVEKTFGAGKIFRKKISTTNVAEQELADVLCTMPLGYQVKLIWLDDLRVTNKDIVNIIIRFLQRPAPRTYLVISLNADPKLGKELLGAAQKTKCLHVKFSAPKFHQLPRWIQARAKRFGKQISPEGARLIAEVVGTDFYAIDTELEKLAVAPLRRGDLITVEDLEVLLSGARISSSFEVMDALASGNAPDAFLKLSDLLESGEQPIAFLGLLARHVRLLWQVKSAEKSGKNLAEIKAIIGLPEFVVSRLVEQSRAFSESDLRELHRGLYEADLSLKTTPVPPLHVLTMILNRLRKRLDTARK